MESDLSDDDAPVVANGLPASSLQPKRGRGRGAGILRAQSVDVPPGWGINASSLVAQPFTRLNAIGPKEIPSSINAGSSPLIYEFMLNFHHKCWKFTSGFSFIVLE